jgi:CRISPR-associated protein Cmr5
MTDSRPTLDQRRARHAWDAVQHALQQSGRHGGQDPKKFGSEVRRLPMRIMVSGLGQALAFVEAKGEVDGLLAELSDWVLEKRGMGARAGGNLLRAVIQDGSDFLRRATDETLAYLQWLKRFAEAEGITDEKEEDRARG